MKVKAINRKRALSHHDPTGDTAADRIDQARERVELGVVAGMAIQSILSKQATNEQLADMVRGLAPWWDGERADGLSRRAWRITDHAATRAVEMGLTPAEVTGLLESPEETRVQGGMSAYEGDVLHLRGDYAAAIAQDSYPQAVVTFLYRYQDSYEAQYENPADGRERRTSHLPRKAA